MKYFYHRVSASPCIPYTCFIPIVSIASGWKKLLLYTVYSQVYIAITNYITAHAAVC